MMAAYGVPLAGRLIYTGGIVELAGGLRSPRATARLRRPAPRALHGCVTPIFTRSGGPCGPGARARCLLHEEPRRVRRPAARGRRGTGRFALQRE